MSAEPLRVLGILLWVVVGSSGVLADVSLLLVSLRFVPESDRIYSAFAERTRTVVAWQE